MNAAGDHRHVAVIGGGPSGIATARWLVEDEASGTTVVLFEKAHALGGTWLYDPRAPAAATSDNDSSSSSSSSSCYASLVTNTPKRLTAFAGKPMPASFPQFPGHQHMREYLQAVADELGPRVRVLLNTTVVDLARCPAGWAVRSRTKGAPDDERMVFDAVAVCVGHHWSPHKPIAAVRGYTGNLLHSRDFRTADDPLFRAKTVLIVGLGVSGGEILQQVARVATYVWCASARHLHGLVALTGLLPEALPADRVELVPALHACDGRAAHLADGRTLANVDTLVLCTGYRICLPFAARAMLAELGVIESPEPLAGEADDTVDASELRLWQRFLAPAHAPSLAFIGFITTYGSLISLADAQARLWVALLRGAVAAPSAAELILEPALWHGARALEHSRQGGAASGERIYRYNNVDYWTYMNAMRRSLGGAAETRRRVTVCAVQGPSVLGDPAANRAAFGRAVETAAREHGAKFVVLPEAAITGYLSTDRLGVSWHVPGRPLGKSPCTKRTFDAMPFEQLLAASEPVPGPSTVFFCALAAACECYITVPLIERRRKPSTVGDEGGSAFLSSSVPWLFYNTIVLVGPSGEICAVYRKVNLWGCVDYAWTTAGTQTSVATTPYGDVGLAVCFDVHVMFDRYARQHAGLWALLYCIAWVDDDIENWFARDLPGLFIAGRGFHVVGANWAAASAAEAAAWRGHGHSGVYEASGKRLAHATGSVGFELVLAQLPYSQHGAVGRAAAAAPFVSRRAMEHAQRAEPVVSLRVCGRTIRIEQGDGDPVAHPGLWLWDSALALAAYCERAACRGELRFAECRVLELGAGTGAAGIALMALGADVLLTDHDPEVLAVLRRNVAWANSGALACGRGAVAALDWTHAGPHEALAGLPPFDWVVVTDAVYDPELVPHFVRTLALVCEGAGDQTRVLLAIEAHHAGASRLFYGSLAKAGFAVEHVRREAWFDAYPVAGIYIKLMRRAPHATGGGGGGGGESGHLEDRCASSAPPPGASAASAAVPEQRSCDLAAVRRVLEPWLAARLARVRGARREGGLEKAA